MAEVEAGMKAVVPTNSHTSSTVSQTPLQRPRNLYLFGYPIAHSLSPALHNFIYTQLGLPWTFSLYETRCTTDFVSKLQDPSFIGASVTMPFKVASMSHVDELTEEARIIGAINAIYVRPDPRTGQRVLIGTNTDCLGVRDAIVENHPSMNDVARGKPALVIGGGGACRAAVYAASRCLGASVVYLVNRDKSEVEQVVQGFRSVGFEGRLLHVATAEQVEHLEAARIIVGTVPDVSPSTREEVEVREIVRAFLQKREKGVLLDMCYHPMVTQIMDLAVEEGWAVISGTEALLFQAVHVNRLWTERSLDGSAIVEQGRKVLEDQHKIHVS